MTIDSVGLSWGSTVMTGTATCTAGSTTILLNATDHALVAAGDFLIIIPDNSSSIFGVYLAVRIVTVNASPSVTVAAAWGGTTGAKTYWFCLNPVGLGNLKSFKRTMESPADTVGLPTSKWHKTLSFDVEGVIMRIDVSGVWKETSRTTLETDMRAVEYILNSSQMNSPPNWFWCDANLILGYARAYPVMVTKFSSTITEKDIGAINLFCNYDISMVCGNIS